MRAVLGRMLRVGAGCCLISACLLTGCVRDQSEEPGVVAVVNGSPIRLAELEARHDVGRLAIPSLDNPAVDELRAAYGATLAEIIVSRLVDQELARLKLTPSAQELAAAEAAVRADYPGDTFERMLLEEHIDPARWRAMLADRLALEKFAREVLRPNVRVGVSEAASYYKDHLDAFTRPASVRVLVVSGRDADAVKAALAAARKSGLGDKAPGVAQAVLPEPGLPAAWREALKSLKPGEASQPLASGREYVGLILVERVPAAVLDPAKAYARVEAMLASEKLDKAFAAWLAETLAEAHVSVNSQLLAAGRPAGPAETPAVAVTDRAELENARAGDAARDYVAGQARKTLDEKRAARAVEPADDAEGAKAPTPSAAPLSAVAEETPPAVAPAPDADQPAEQGKAAGPALTDGETPPAAGLAAAMSQDPTASPGPAATTPPVAAVATQDAPASPTAAPAASAPAPVAPDATSEPAQLAQETASPPAAPELGATGTPAASPAASGDASPGAASNPPVQAPPAQAQGGPGEVEFVAVKASWILYTVDEGREERVYLKPGKPQRIAYTRRLMVRLGSPSEVTYRAGGRETTVEVGKKESRVLEFP